MDESAKKSIRELFGEDFSKILEAYEDKLKSLQKLCNKYENDFHEEVSIKQNYSKIMILIVFIVRVRCAIGESMQRLC